MKYGSVCSGVEAATVAWHGLGWEPQWFSQYDPEHNYKNGLDFPSAVLNHHYPEIPNLGDMAKLKERDEFTSKPIDLLVGGTPCQAFSVAGLRGGLADGRGNLALEFVRILTVKQPRWFLWENVPGVLSSNGGADFASILSAWTGRHIAPQKFPRSGVVEGEFYSIAWRVLDAQYFGVAQRRRRVFVVGHLGKDWRPPVAVLLERESLRGDFKKGGKKRQETTRETGAGAFSTSGAGYWREGTGALRAREQDSHENIILTKGYRMVAFGEYADDNTASTVKARDYKDATDIVCYDTTQRTSKANGSNPRTGDPCHPLAAQAHAPLVCFGWQNSPSQSMAVDAISPTLDKSKTPAICYGLQGDTTPKSAEQIMPTLRAREKGGGSVQFCSDARGIVRRLTPIETERLQGFPDSYTNIPWRGKPDAPDGHRYKAMGNSMAVPCMSWIGRRIDKVDKLINNPC